MERTAERLSRITLEEPKALRLSPKIEHERRVAVHDLLEENTFSPVGQEAGPYHLNLGVTDGRLAFDLRDEDEEPVTAFTLSMAPFKGIVRDYFMVCDSYYKAITDSSPSRIEAIDMGRRGLHNDGAALLRENLAGKALVDEDTARRLFTLICVLHIRP